MSRTGSTGTPVANAGLATSIIGLCLSVIGLFLINPFMLPGVLGILFSIWGLVRSRAGSGTSKTVTKVLAIIGIVIGALAIIGWILGLFVRHS